MPTLTIDGRTVQASPGQTILEVARDVGIGIPTLCHHEALEPWGGCRLCLVDVTRAEWDGWRKAVVSCMARADDGLIVDTRSERVVAARKVALDLLLARCPDTAAIRELAAEHGLSSTSYRARGDADDCILCGLCTRVCEAYATSAIATWGRGTRKAVGTFAHQPPADCVGCGACALVCPTGHIRGERTADGYEIWQRSFSTHVCAVDTAHCIGCGSCEEQCPFSVPRVALRIDGTTVATIPAEHCRGCGACVGACPTGAIDQATYGGAALARVPTADASVHQAPAERGATVPVAVMACGRSALAQAGGASRREFAASVSLLDVPCSGRATVALLLARLAAGDGGVLVLGRHQGTCRLDGAEDPAVEQVQRAQQLLELIGIEPERVAFASPAPGLAGPAAEVASFCEQVGALGGPIASGRAGPEPAQGDGLDVILSLAAGLSARANAGGAGRRWLRDQGLPEPTEGGPLLFAGDLPYLAVVGERWWRPLRMAEVLKDAVRLLAALGFADVGVAHGGYRTLRAPEREALLRARRVFVLTAQDAALLGAASIRAERLDQLLSLRVAQLGASSSSAPVGCDGSAGQVQLLRALGRDGVDVGPDPLSGEGFRFSAERRRAAEARLQQAEARGARSVLVQEPAALARWALVARDGTWRQARPRPVMPHQLALESLRRRTHPSLPWELP